MVLTPAEYPAYFIIRIQNI